MPSWIWFFVIVVGLPVVAGILGDTAKRWMKLKERQLELHSRETAEKAAQYGAHVERLEQRVRVLERIAIDKGTHLAAEIDDLRDERMN